MDVTAQHIGSLNLRGDADESQLVRLHRELLGLEQARLPDVQRRSLEFLEKALRTVLDDQLQRKFLANVMYEVLEDLKPRRIMSRSGAVEVLVLPTAGADQATPISLCGIRSAKEGIALQDVKLPAESRWKGGPGSMYPTLVRKYAEALRETFPRGDFAQMCGSSPLRPDVDLHSLYDSLLMRKLFRQEFLPRLDWNLTWAKDHGIRLPGAEGLQDSSTQTACFEILMKIANSQVRRGLESVLKRLPLDVVNPLWNSSECYTGDLARACSAKTEREQVNRARWHATFPLYRTLAEQTIALTHIDENRFTVARIANQLGGSPALIRRLGGWPCSTLQRVQLLNPIELARVLSEVNINHIPQYKKCSQAETEAFTSVIAQTGRLVGIQSRTPSAFHAAKNLLKNTAGKWAEVHAAASKDEVDHATDFIKAFAQRTLLAAFFRLETVAEDVLGYLANDELEHIIPRRDRHLFPGHERLRTERDSKNSLVNQWNDLSATLLVAALSETWSLGSIIQASKAWHKVVGNSSFKQAFQMWPALTEPLTAPNGIQLIPLTTSAELAEEGQAMRHCVGSYSQDCLLRGSHIFSVRDRDGGRLSTLQLIQEGRSVRKAQNRGSLNQLPHTRADKTANWFVQKINRGTIPVQWDELIAKQRMIRMTSGIHEVLGFDPHDHAIWNKAFSEFKSSCPKHLRSETVEGFVLGLVKLFKDKKVATTPVRTQILTALENELRRDVAVE
jgi:hypothetical protein